MTDTEMLDWFQLRGVAFQSNPDNLYELQWLDDDGIRYTTNGTSLRDCIYEAAIKQKKWDNYD